MQVYNSWGEKWGNKGFTWIDYTTFLKMIKQAFYIEKPMVNKQSSQQIISNSNKQNKNQSASNGNDKVSSGSGSTSGSETNTKNSTPNSKLASGKKTILEPVFLTPNFTDESTNYNQKGPGNSGILPEVKDFIKPSVISEPIKKGRNFFTMGVTVNPIILPKVTKVYYQYYVSPEYYEEEEVTKAPFFKKRWQISIKNHYVIFSPKKAKGKIENNVIRYELLFPP